MKGRVEVAVYYVHCDTCECTARGYNLLLLAMVFATQINLARLYSICICITKECVHAMLLCCILPFIHIIARLFTLSVDDTHILYSKQAISECSLK